MKKLFIIAGIALATACNVNVDERDDSDSLENELDTFINRADTTLEKWGDSAEAKYKDVKRDVRDRLDDDDRDRGDTSRR